MPDEPGGDPPCSVGAGWGENSGRREPAGPSFSLAQGRGQRSLRRASGNWRITFGWDGEDAIEVDLEDYR